MKAEPRFQKKAITLTRADQDFAVYPVDPPGNPDFWSQAAGWELETFEALGELLRPGVVFWDVGAWCGPFTLYAKAIGATTWAFEPDPIAHAHLIDNLTLDQGPQAGPVFALNVACGAAAGWTRLYTAELGNSQTTLRGQGTDNAIDVPVLRLDDLAAHIQPPPEVIKIDVEGMEGEALEGMLETLEEHRPALVISLHPGYLYGKDWAIIDRVAALYGVTTPRDNALPLVWRRR